MATAMRTADLQQPPYDTSQMGVAKGALDHYGIACTPGKAFVASGHAFVLNVHEELCPSGPYVWHYLRSFELLRNLGLDVELLGMALPNAAASEKAVLEAKVREALDAGAVCSVLNLDHQLILGYDDAGFVLAQPWGDASATTPARLSYGSWHECNVGPQLVFYQFTQCEPAVGAEARAISAALDFGLELWRHPGHYADERYGLGAKAYANWIAGLDAGGGDVHGNWWNGVVWGECRERAGDYFQDLAAADFPGPIDQEPARHLAIGYRSVARLLYRAADKTATVADKRGFVAEAQEIETSCMERIAALRGCSLGS